MLLLSWNVAAWPTVLALLPPGGAKAFFEGHGADLVCLQEVKISLRKLRAMSASLSLDGWQIFWAPCTDDRSRGFQGVATCARDGLTTRANPSPLGDADLDAMGRCLRTDHAGFILFNVYAPAAANGTRARMRFFRALRKAMRRARAESGKPVVLCGDLNVARNARDVHFLRARVRVRQVMRGETRCCCGMKSNGRCCRVKEELAEAWESIVQALGKKMALREKSRSSKTGEVRERFRLALEVGGDVVKVGKLQDSEEECLALFGIEPGFWEDPELGEMKVMAYPEEALAVGELHELMKVVAKVEWNGAVLRKLAENAGESPNAVPIVKLFDEMIEEDGMCDTFRHLYPEATFRFTCWNQYTNGRYSNHGARIDYFLVDNSLIEAIVKEPITAVTLRCGCSGGTKAHYTMQGEHAARCAATAGDRFQAAAFQGGGLGDASDDAMQSQFGPPHTGIVYTPPKYSDHVAVSLLLDDSVLAAGQPTQILQSCVLDTSDKATRAAQPHLEQPSIKAFFSKPTFNSEKPSIPSAKVDTPQAVVVIVSPEKSTNSNSQPVIDLQASPQTNANQVFESDSLAITSTESSQQNATLNKTLGKEKAESAKLKRKSSIPQATKGNKKKTTPAVQSNKSIKDFFTKGKS